MLRYNYRTLFTILLIPSYLFVLVGVFGLTMGYPFEWKYISIYVILNFLGAWLLSYRKNFVLNILGFVCFIYYGWPFFAYIFKHPKIGPWPLNVGAGILIIILGLMGLIYSILKRIKSPIPSE